MNYYRHIDRNILQFDFLYFEEVAESHLDEITELGGRSFFIPYPTFKIADQKKLHLFFSEHQGEYIAVHCHPIWGAEIVGIEAKKSGISHVIQHSHSTKFADKKLNAIRNGILIKFVGLFATDYMACSPEAAYLFGKHRVDRGRVHILPNAIELANYSFDVSLREIVRKEFNFSSDTIVVGNIGRMCIQKNQLYALDVFNEFHLKIPKSKMMIVGDGSLRRQLEKRVEELSLTDSVIMTGKRRDIKAILSALDVFLMPSLFEGAPVAAIEALASGLPCIISDTITKSVDVKGVYYLPITEEPMKWADKVITVLEERHKTNRSDQSELVSHGFDIKRESQRLEAFYLDLE
ncbi:MAG: glycosyltransferase [Firmicutes bacterium]|nr:glycosyltransferase [Bacillota bacterium]